MAKKKTNSKSKKQPTIFKRILNFCFKVVLYFFLGSLIYAIALIWMPVPYTLTMLSRKIDAISEGSNAEIYYDWVSYEEISDYAKVAVMASEDQKFPTHNGFDWESIEKAMEDNEKRVKKGKRARGASTISQQVAKNVFLIQKGGFVRKGMEVYFTFLIETLWSKERILEVYLNIAEMGPRTFGVQASAQRFFKRDAKKLSLSQSATLAAVLPNPIKFSAKNPSGYVLRRRRQITRQINNLGGKEFLKTLEKTAEEDKKSN